MRIIGIDDDAARVGVPSRSATFGYDAFGHLTESTSSLGDAAAETITYGYDADNITTRSSSLGAASPEHDGLRTLDATHPHAVTQAGDLTLGYDARGYVTARNDWRLAWDGFGRLTETTRGAEVVRHTHGRGFERVTTERPDGTSYYMSDRFEVEEGVASVYLTLGASSVARIEVPRARDRRALGPRPRRRHQRRRRVARAGRRARRLGPLGVDGPRAARDLAAPRRARHDRRRDRRGRRHRRGVAAIPLRRPALELDEHPRGDGLHRQEERRGHRSRLHRHALVRPALGRWTAPDHVFETIDPSMLREPAEALGAYAYVRNNPLGGQDENGALTRKEQNQARNFVQALASVILDGNVRPLEETANQSVGQNEFGLGTDSKEEAAVALLDKFDEWRDQIDELTKTDSMFASLRSDFDTVVSDPNLHAKVIYYARQNDLHGDENDGTTNHHLKKAPPRPQLKRSNLKPYVPSVSLASLSGVLVQQMQPQKHLQQQQQQIDSIEVALSSDGTGDTMNIGGRNRGNAFAASNNKGKRVKGLPKPPRPQAAAEPAEEELTRARSRVAAGSR